MANSSILAAFERMWQHVIAKISTKANISDVEELSAKVGNTSVSEQITTAISNLDIVYAYDEDPETTVAPVNADTLGGIPAADFAVKDDLTAEEVGAAPAIQSYTYAGCYYRMVGDEREWINPPMVLGEEYRTTERLDRLVVYTKIMNFGEMPHNSSKTVHDVVDGSIFSVDGIVFNADGVPFVTFATNQSISCDFLGSNVSVGTTYEFSNCTAYLIVKYLKM